MSRIARYCFAAVLALLGVLVPASSVAAHSSSTGGAAAFEKPAIDSLKCGTGEQASCPPGQVLRLNGENLARTSKVVFLGNKGRQDDRHAAPSARSPHRVLISVPVSARSGRVRVITTFAKATGPRVTVARDTGAAAPTAPVGSAEGVFPIQGTHDYGTEVNRFGGGRGHKGQDVFAKCGTPLVSAVPGVVTLARFQDRAGYYVVIKADDGTSQAYMHMRAAATVEKGQHVQAGQPIGAVGDTGRADGCHLHFELWTAPGWYEGGEAIDPLPALKRWDSATAARTTRG